MASFLLAMFLFCNFNLKWLLPQGVSGANTRVLVQDTDRDAGWELMFTTYGISYYVYVYELHLPSSWNVDSILYPNAPLLWDGGDFDIDGLYDLAMQCGSSSPFWVGVTVIESPDSFSYPTQEAWRDTVGPPLVLPISVYDMDQDNLPELVVNRAIPYGDIGIYESIGDNQYQMIFADDPDTLHYDAPAATHAFGDFDEDGYIECVFAGADDPYWIYECIGNNSYVKIAEGELPTGNIRDCLSIPDADGDGKLEFMLKGYDPSTARIEAFVLEATGDNTYAVIGSFNLAGGSVYYWGGLSDAGDVDGDSVPEILIEGCQTVYIVKAAGNDSFYVWETLPGYLDGCSVRVFDLDGNGLPEVIISGYNRTNIYEYEVGVAETTVHEVQEGTLAVYPNPFRDCLYMQFTAPNEVVSIEIFDSAGRLVKSFDRESCIMNRESPVCWQVNRHLPAGVYFLELQIGDYRTTEKLVLVR